MYHCDQYHPGHAMDTIWEHWKPGREVDEAAAETHPYFWVAFSERFQTVFRTNSESWNRRELRRNSFFRAFSERFQNDFRTNSESRKGRILRAEKVEKAEVWTEPQVNLWPPQAVHVATPTAGSLSNMLVTACIGESCYFESIDCGFPLGSILHNICFCLLYPFDAAYQPNRLHSWVLVVLGY